MRFAGNLFIGVCLKAVFADLDISYERRHSMSASECSVVLTAIRGCDRSSAIARLECMQWIVVTAVEPTEGTFVMTARHPDRQMRVYGRHGKVWTANFGRRATAP